MEKYFVTYNQSLALKELGFDIPCMGKYDTKQGNEWFLNIYSGHLNTQFGDKNKACIAPLKSQVFEWFRKEHNLFGVVLCDLCWNISGGVANSYGDAYDWDSERYETYEEAEIACIDKLIEIIKKK